MLIVSIPIGIGLRALTIFFLLSDVSIKVVNQRFNNKRVEERVEEGRVLDLVLVLNRLS